MSPVAVIALVRDILIVVALAFVVWWIRHDGVNSAKVGDLQAIQSQLADNALRQQKIAQEVSNAQAQHTQDLQTISAAIASHSAEPVRVCVSPSPSAVHGIPTASSANPAAGRSVDPGPGVAVPPIDIRPGLIAFEQHYENALADCRQALAQWPSL